MLTRLAAGAVALTTMVSLPVLGHGLATEPGSCYPNCTAPPVVTPVAGAGSVAVTVSGAGGTSGGGSFTVPSHEVWVPPVCYYIRMGSGREYADAINHGLEDSVLRMLPAAERSIELPGWQDHATDDDGAWWIPVCDDLTKFDAYNARNDPVYVVPGVAPPVGEVAVPPEVLAEIASEAMDLPAGTIRWNPSSSGSGVTVVNVDTWVWVENGPTTVSITASVPGVSATVDAALDHLDVSAAGADPARCAGAGVAWSEGADPAAACTIVFSRSSANQAVRSGQTLPTSTLTATATWTASWTSSLDPTRTDLPSQDITTSAEIPVAEIQSVVTSQ